MKVCIIGDGLTSLSLAKNLINKKISVHIYHKKITGKFLSNRTIGISKNNLKFFKKEIEVESQEYINTVFEILKVVISGNHSVIQFSIDSLYINDQSFFYHKY